MNIHSAQSLNTLPIEFIYRIMDYLDGEDLVFSFYGLCSRINRIMDTYERYKVYILYSFLVKRGSVMHDYLEFGYSTILLSW